LKQSEIEAFFGQNELMGGLDPLGIKITSIEK